MTSPSAIRLDYSFRTAPASAARDSPHHRLLRRLPQRLDPALLAQGETPGADLTAPDDRSAGCRRRTRPNYRRRAVLTAAGTGIPAPARAPSRRRVASAGRRESALASLAFAF